MALTYYVSTFVIEFDITLNSHIWNLG